MVPGNKHGPNKLSNYLSTHDTVMGQFREREFVLADDIAVRGLGLEYVKLVGSIRCAGGIVVTVDKTLRILDGEGMNALVENVQYSYNVHVTGRGNVVRYDAPHAHRPYHHAHRFDFFNGGDGLIDQLIGDSWPTLGDVLLEAEKWYHEHAAELATE